MQRIIFKFILANDLKNIFCHLTKVEQNDYFYTFQKDKIKHG